MERIKWGHIIFLLYMSPKKELLSRFRVRIQEGLAGVRPFENPVEDKRHLYRIEASVKVKRYLS